MTGTAEEPRDSLIPLESIRLIWHGVDHPEGLALDVDGTLWCGGEDGQIYRGRFDGEPEQIAKLPGRTLGFALDGEGNAYCADMTEPGIYRIDRAGAVATVSTGTVEQPARVPNHPAFLPSGHLVYTDSGEWDGADGCLFVVQPDGTTRVADRSACNFPNGLAVSPARDTLAVVESTLPGVSFLSISDDGSLGDRRVAVELPGTIPDGVAFDARGRLLVSCWTPDAILLVTPEGAVMTLASDPRRFMLNQPTNIAFVPDSSTIIAANIGERFLSVFEHDTTGAELPRPDFCPTTPYPYTSTEKEGA
jgi:gluconolactonase